VFFLRLLSFFGPIVLKMAVIYMTEYSKSAGENISCRMPEWFGRNETSKKTFGEFF
jgi:cytochrome c biogenesis protein CcdA